MGDLSTMIGHHIVRLETVTSTMDVAAELAVAGADEGLVVVANEQTAGRGRAGRVWRAPAGSGVFMSVVLRPDVPPARMGCLSLVVGVAVARALETYGLSPKLKWPNDVWLGGQKVAGILVTTRVGSSATTAIVGIGINVRVPMAQLPPGATSLHLASDREVSPESVLQALCSTLDQEYARFVQGKGSPDLRGWTERAALLGETVTVEDGPAVHIGVLVGIDGQGALRLRTADGRIISVVAGDLTRGPRHAARID